jgi:hypothetical protein
MGKRVTGFSGETAIQADRSTPGTVREEPPERAFVFFGFSCFLKSWRDEPAFNDLQS